MSSAWRRWVALFEDADDPAEPHFDPVHLAVVLVACIVVSGALFWLLWTLFVYEGGLPLKLGAWIAPDPQQRVSADGWLANVAALALSALVLAFLYHADFRARRRAK